MADILSQLRPAAGSTKKTKRIGRGQGSGHGGTSTRGHNGQHSRSGAKFKVWFEGGQMPLVRRIPKFGFTNPFRVEYQVVNLERLEELAASGMKEVSPASLYEAGVIAKKSALIKILGDGKLSAKLTVSAHKFSKTAKEKIESVGGVATVIA